MRQGKNVWCDLPAQAVAINAAFTRATRLLGIDDLRFHDLRHDGVSRLFKIGRRWLKRPKSQHEIRSLSMRRENRGARQVSQKLFMIR